MVRTALASWSIPGSPCSAPRTASGGSGGWGPPGSQLLCSFKQMHYEIRTLDQHAGGPLKLPVIMQCKLAWLRHPWQHVQHARGS